MSPNKKLRPNIPVQHDEVTQPGKGFWHSLTSLFRHEPSAFQCRWCGKARDMQDLSSPKPPLCRPCLGATANAPALHTKMCVEFPVEMQRWVDSMNASDKASPQQAFWDGVNDANQEVLRLRAEAIAEIRARNSALALHLEQQADALAKSIDAQIKEFRRTEKVGK